MPQYDYAHLRPARCQDFSVVQRMRDDALAKCPTCGKKVRRVIYAPAVKVKKSSIPVQKLFERKFGKEKTFTVPGSGKVVKLKGPQSGWRRQAYNAYAKENPGTRYDDFQLLNT